jgi:PAS domain S-box-containing protein
MNITEVPAGYITITSGLGDTPPDNLLLVPVLHENEILGVVEIASLNKFRKHEIDFAQEVAFSLGSTLVTTRNNQRTSELLEKSQQQALEMAEQEEEMRQNMEELKATQEESSRREEELSGIANAIDHSLMIIEYNLEGKINNVNDNFCHFLGRDREELIGKSHQEALGGSLNADAAFWNELQKNDHLALTETLKIGRKSVEISEHFARVNNRNNAIVKYINFASNGRVGNS